MEKSILLDHILQFTNKISIDNQIHDNDPVMQMISKLSILSRARVQLMKNDIDTNDVMDTPTLHML